MELTKVMQRKNREIDDKSFRRKEDNQSRGDDAKELERRKKAKEMERKQSDDEDMIETILQGDG